METVNTSSSPHSCPPFPEVKLSLVDPDYPYCFILLCDLSSNYLIYFVSDSVLSNDLNISSTRIPACIIIEIAGYSSRALIFIKGAFVLQHPNVIA